MEKNISKYFLLPLILTTAFKNAIAELRVDDMLWTDAVIAVVDHQKLNDKDHATFKIHVKDIGEKPIIEQVILGGKSISCKSSNTSWFKRIMIFFGLSKYNTNLKDTCYIQYNYDENRSLKIKELYIDLTKSNNYLGYPYTFDVKVKLSAGNRQELYSFIPMTFKLKNGANSYHLNTYIASKNAPSICALLNKSTIIDFGNISRKDIALVNDSLKRYDENKMAMFNPFATCIIDLPDNATKADEIEKVSNKNDKLFIDFVEKDKIKEGYVISDNSTKEYGAQMTLYLTNDSAPIKIGDESYMLPEPLTNHYLYSASEDYQKQCKEKTIDIYCNVQNYYDFSWFLLLQAVKLVSNPKETGKFQTSFSFKLKQDLPNTDDVYTKKVYDHINTNIHVIYVNYNVVE